MTKERINDFKKIVLPSISKLLFDVNYEGQGKCDSEEFTKDFNEILDLASKALEQKPRFILHSDGKIEQIIEPCDVVLDKIKDEIFDIDDTTVLNPDSFYERKVYIRFNRVIDIINKYKTKSEAAE